VLTSKEGISIIIPTYNNQLGLKTTINSLKRLINDTNHEIIIVNGGESFDVFSLAGAGNNVFYIDGKDNGIYDAMNKGVACSSFDWVYFLGDDDYVLPSFSYNKFKRFLLSNKRIVAGSILYSDGTRFSSYLNEDLFFKNTIHHQAALYNRKHLLKYRLKYSLLADFDMNQQLLIGTETNLLFESVSFVDFDFACCSLGGRSQTQLWKMRFERFLLCKNKINYILVKIKKVIK
jgi:glycosyltransferase involved in cell wall biosynthesis